MPRQTEPGFFPICNPAASNLSGHRNERGGEFRNTIYEAN
jgi:hypothetical protein